MFLASVLIAGREGLWPSAVLVLAALGVLAWLSRRASGQGPLQAVCFALKLLGFLALAAWLFGPFGPPGARRPRRKTGRQQPAR